MQRKNPITLIIPYLILIEILLSTALPVPGVDRRGKKGSGGSLLHGTLRGRTQSRALCRWQEEYPGHPFEDRY